MSMGVGPRMGGAVSTGLYPTDRRRTRPAERHDPRELGLGAPTCVDRQPEPERDQDGARQRVDRPPDAAGRNRSEKVLAASANPCPHEAGRYDASANMATGYPHRDPVSRTADEAREQHHDLRVEQVRQEALGDSDRQRPSGGRVAAVGLRTADPGGAEAGNAQPHPASAAAAWRRRSYTSAEALQDRSNSQHADAVAQIEQPGLTAQAVSSAARRPPRKALRVTTAMSGRE